MKKVDSAHQNHKSLVNSEIRKMTEAGQPSEKQAPDGAAGVLVHCRELN